MAIVVDVFPINNNKSKKLLLCFIKINPVENYCDGYGCEI